MAKGSAHRGGTASALGVRGAAYVAALGCIVGCAQVLGIPTDLELAPSPGAPPLDSGRGELPAPSAEPPSGAAEPDATLQAVAPSEPAEPALDGAAADGIVPAGDVAGIDETLEPVRLAPDAPALGPDAEAADAGSGAPLEGPTEAPCEGLLDRIPVDVVFIVDNSASMAAAVAAFEAALPAFVARLDRDGVDHRVILLSRHRQAARNASDDASSSVCVAAPVSGLAECPSERPAPGPRFFPYGIEIGATDSFERALEAFSNADPFGLTKTGWSEWLRVAARKVFIEITDDDAALSGADFVDALAAAAPEHFDDDPTRPGFVFHSLLGMAQKVLELDLYGPDEPVELDVCTGSGTNPDNAGSGYQELSRSTGGLRQSICPAGVLALRLQVLAVDVVRRSIQGCSLGG